MNVDTPHKEYSRLMPLWAKCRDVVDAKVKAKADLYLRPLSGQSGPEDEDYLNYLFQAYFYNATGRTVDALKGAVFRKEPTVIAPDSMQDFLDDVNLAGCSLRDFLENLFQEELEVTKYGVLVDHNGTFEQANDSTFTRRRAEQLNVRPKFAGYAAESIINWRYDTVNGRYQLILVVLRETYSVTNEVDYFQEEERTRFRVLRLVDGVYTQEVWETQEKVFNLTVEPFTPLQNGSVLNEIPFRLFPEEPRDPVIEDLVESNLAHYRRSADYEWGNHWAGIPTMLLTGIKKPNNEEGEGFHIGGLIHTTASKTDVDGKYIEFQGRGLGEIEKNLGKKELHMASLGARLLQESPKGVETAEAVAIKQMGENSVLATLAGSVSEGMTWCLEHAARWMGIDDDVSIELNKDYLPATITPDLLAKLMNALQQGYLSKESWVYNLHRGELLPDGRTMEEELDAQENEQAEMVEASHEEAEFMSSLSDESGPPAAA